MVFLDAVASPSTYPLSVSGSMSESVIVSDLEIAIASLSFVSLFVQLSHVMLVLWRL